MSRPLITNNANRRATTFVPSSTPSSSTPSSPTTAASPSASTVAASNDANSKAGRRATQFGGISDKCSLCGKAVYAQEKLQASAALVFHKNCFKCFHCKSTLMIGNFALAEDGQVYCEQHYKQLFALKTGGPAPASKPTKWGEVPEDEDSSSSPASTEASTPVEQQSALPTPPTTPPSPIINKPTPPVSQPAQPAQPSPASPSPTPASPVSTKSPAPAGSPHPIRGGAPKVGGPGPARGGGAPPGAGSPKVGAGPVSPKAGPPKGGAPKGPAPDAKKPQEEELRKKEELEAQKAPLPDVDVDSLVEYPDADAVMKGRTVTALKKDISVGPNNPGQTLNLIREMFRAIATPQKSAFLKNVRPGSKNRDDIEQKISYISATLLQESNTRFIHDLVFRHSLLEILFELFDSTTRISSLTACYFRDVLTNFIRYRREDVLSFLITKPGSKSLAVKVLNHIESDEIAQFFIDLLDREPAPIVPVQAAAAKGGRGGAPAPPPQKAVYWSKDPELMKALVSKLLILQEGTPANRLFGERITENAAMVISSILERSASHSHLVKDLLFSVDRLVVASTKGAMSSKFDSCTFVHILKTLTQMVICISRNWSFEDDKNPKQVFLKGVAEKLIKAVPTYITFLNKPPPTSSSIKPLDIFKCLPPASQGPFGFVRFSIIEFFSELVKASFAQPFEAELISSGLLVAVTDQFFTFMHNTFLHDLVTNNVYIPILIGDSTTLMNHLFLDCKLLQRIVDNYQGLDHRMTAKPNTYQSYNGHLTQIANSIATNKLLDSLPVNSDTNNLKLKWVAMVRDKLGKVLDVQTTPPHIES